MHQLSSNSLLTTTTLLATTLLTTTLLTSDSNASAEDLYHRQRLWQLHLQFEVQLQNYDEAF
jgi:hypothetical protein